MTSDEYTAARLTVRLDAVQANYREIARRVAPGRAAGVVKADAYGLGHAPVAHALAEAGCNTFFVARIGEGIALRALLPAARIFVLDGATRETASALVAHGLIPILNSLDEIDVWIAHGRAAGRVLEAGMQADTGMNRSGLGAAEIAALAGDAKRLAGFRLVHVLGHLACADDPAHPMNAQQLARFRAVLAALPPAEASFAASGGVLLGRDYHFDLVRPGIALYGGNPQPAGPQHFRAAAILEGRILQLRRVDKGETVGYGATFRAGRPLMLATVALGYADGVLRSAAGRGAGAVGGVRAPVAGRVSMDLAVFDVSDVPESQLRPGGWLEIFGDMVTLDEFAAAAGTVNYEILTRIGPRVPRIYSGGGGA